MSDLRKEYVHSVAVFHTDIDKCVGIFTLALAFTDLNTNDTVAVLLHFFGELIQAFVVFKFDIKIDLSCSLLNDFIQLAKHLQRKDDAYKRNDNAFNKADARRKSKTSASPDARRRCQTADLISAGYDDRTDTEEADAADDLCAKTRRITRAELREHILACDHNHRRTDANEDMRFDTGNTTLHFTVDTDDKTNPHRKQKTDGDAEHAETFTRMYDPVPNIYDKHNTPP